MAITSKMMVKKAMHRDNLNGAIPVMCQLSIGNILLNTGVNPRAFNFTNAGFTEGVLRARELYNFDGILLHKPGREEDITAIVDHYEDSPDGEVMVMKDGAAIVCTPNDDPKYYPTKDFSSVFDGYIPVQDIDLINPFGWMSESYYHWCLHKGLHPWKKASDFPGYYFATIDSVVAKVGATCSIHGETKAPTDYLMNYIGLQNALMAMIEYPDQCNAIMDYFTENCIAWSLAQLQHGCDAIKVSSPYAGGSFISRKHYLEFVYPYEKKLAQAVTAAGGLIYTHTCGAIGDRLDLIVDTGVSGIECLDPPPLGNVELPDAVAQWSQKIFIKGNVDSVNTLLLKDVPGVREDVQQVLSAGILAPGYIMSTACSVAPAVPKENLQAMVDVVKTYNQSR